MRYADPRWRSSPGCTHIKGRVSETEGRLVGSRNLKEDGAGAEKDKLKTMSENGGRKEHRKQKTSRSSTILTSTQGETGSSQMVLSRAVI